MLNTCYDSFTSCYLCHSFYIYLFAVLWVEHGEASEGMREGEKGGRLSSTRWCKEVVFAWCFTHTSISAQWATGNSSSVPWVISLVCAPLGELSTHISAVYFIWLLWLFQMERLFKEVFPSSSMTSDIEDIANYHFQKTDKTVLWNNPLFMLIKIPYL